MAPTMVNVRIIPSAINTMARTIPIILPVRFRMNATKSHRTANGQKIHGALCLVAPAIFYYLLCWFKSTVSIPPDLLFILLIAVTNSVREDSIAILSPFYARQKHLRAADE